MRRMIHISLVLAFLVTFLTACKSEPRSREFTPGKGWTETPK